MTLLHIAIRRACSITHDDGDTESLMLSIEIFGLVVEFWIGVRR